TEDVTGRVLHLMGTIGYRLDFGRARRAVEFLRRTQRSDGSWWGRWGVNFIYGTWGALAGLERIGEDMRAPYVRRAVEWLATHQNPDGGWGETVASYDDESLAGKGESTPSQTAWALLGLLAADGPSSPAVERGVDWLVRTQGPDGTWQERLFTGTGFPRHFYLRYHLYRHYFPLMALGQSLAARALPLEPFRDLLEAFRRDAAGETRRFATFADLLGYCRCSANPVGRLVLALFGHRDAARQSRADDICTALQLTNFWQDVAGDLDRGRVYLPEEDLARCPGSHEALATRRVNAGFRDLLAFEVPRTRALFERGLPLADMVGRRLRHEVRIFARGGLPILARIEAAGYDVFAGRPRHPIGVALADTVERFAIAREHFEAVITGVETDLRRDRYETWEGGLAEYCHRVASSVGLIAIEIFGYQNPSARQYAVHLGLAFQLTNILRDVAEDARRGRIYLPREDLRRFDCREDDVLAGRCTEAFQGVMAFECARAGEHYGRARFLLAEEDRPALAPAEAMRLIYE